MSENITVSLQLSLFLKVHYFHNKKSTYTTSFEWSKKQQTFCYDNGVVTASNWQNPHIGQPLVSDPSMD